MIKIFLFIVLTIIFIVLEYVALANNNLSLMIYSALSAMTTAFFTYIFITDRNEKNT